MYFVYIMTNRSKSLYTGVTNNLMRRVREHKTGIASGFTAKYKLDRLVYFERFDDIHNAIEREKRIKSWLRIKKIALITLRFTKFLRPPGVNPTPPKAQPICPLTCMYDYLILYIYRS